MIWNGLLVEKTLMCPYVPYVVQIDFQEQPLSFKVYLWQS